PQASPASRSCCVGFSDQLAMSRSVKRSMPIVARRSFTAFRYLIVTSSTGNHPTSGPHSVDMLEMEKRASMERLATPDPLNSTAEFKTSSWLYIPHSVMMTSLPSAPAGSVPSSTTWMERGICHQKSPVAQAAAASVRTIGVPIAPSAPYIFECESEATTNDPGTTYPRS